MGSTLFKDVVEGVVMVVWTAEGVEDIEVLPVISHVLEAGAYSGFCSGGGGEI